MLPVAAFELAAHGQVPGVQVDVVPGQPKDLTSPESERDGEHERGPVRLVLGGRKEGLRLLYGQRFDIGGVVAGACASSTGLHGRRRRRTASLRALFRVRRTWLTDPAFRPLSSRTV